MKLSVSPALLGLWHERCGLIFTASGQLDLGGERQTFPLTKMVAAEGAGRGGRCCQVSRGGKAGRPAADNGFVLPARGWRPPAPLPGSERPLRASPRGRRRSRWGPGCRARRGWAQQFTPSRPACFRFAQPPCPKAYGERRVAVSCEVAVSCLLFV